jgi:hypothetical protein
VLKLSTLVLKPFTAVFIILYLVVSIIMAQKYTTTIIYPSTFDPKNSNFGSTVRIVYPIDKGTLSFD